MVTVSDFWTPHQRQKYSSEWNDDQTILESLQVGRGQKRTFDEMQDDAQVAQDEERPFNIESVTQVNTKKFRTTGMNYRVQFTTALADVEISSLHE